jgi:hypothetical protein
LVVWVNFMVVLNIGHILPEFPNVREWGL